MFGMGNIRQPVSFGTLFGPRQRNEAGIGEAAFNRLQQELAKDAVQEDENVQSGFEGSAPTVPVEDATEITLLKNEIANLRTLLAMEQASTEALRNFGSKLAKKLIGIFQLDEEDMTSCIRLNINTEVPNVFWQIQRSLWGPQAWGAMEEEYLNAYGSMKIRILLVVIQLHGLH